MYRRCGNGDHVVQTVSLSRADVLDSESVLGKPHRKAVTERARQPGRDRRERKAMPKEMRMLSADS
jgi:hypothetical protein